MLAMIEQQAPRFETDGFSLEPHARRIDKPWGHEVIMTPPDAPYCFKLISVRAGKQLSLQIHDVKVETQTLISGEAVLVIEGADGELHEVAMRPGLGYHIAVGQRHRLRAITDMTVIEASTPECGTTYRLADDFAREHETEAVRARDRATP